MTLTIKRKISHDTAIELTVDGTDQTEMLLAVTWVNDLDSQCGKCGTPDIGLRTRRVKSKGDEFNYPEQHCRKCGATRSLSQYKTAKGIMYVKPGWNEAYNDNGGQE